MLNGTTPLSKLVLSFLFFPVFFQEAMLKAIWSAEGLLFVTVLKRGLMLLPALAFLLACWVTIACALSVLVRQKRGEFITAIFINWWDLGRAIIIFWGGIFRFLFLLGSAVFGVFKLVIVGVWLLIQDFVLLPFRIVKGIGENVLSPGIPWIAVLLTVTWALLEAVIFTYVMTPLVLDTFSNMTGEQLSELAIRVPLFLFMFFIVLGSYSVLSTLVDALKERSVPNIIKIAVIESVAMFVEVIFLYREFVDSLVPWFAQHASKDFQLGIFGTLAIAGVTWVGVRGLSWFLFAAHGTPTIMAVIRGAGVLPAGQGSQPRDVKELLLTYNFIHQIKGEMESIRKMGDDLLAAFVIPPLQVLAACVNFCVLLITTEHLFRLPFKSMEDVMSSDYSLHTPKRMKNAA